MGAVEEVVVVVIMSRVVVAVVFVVIIVIVVVGNICSRISPRQSRSHRGSSRLSSSCSGCSIFSGRDTGFGGKQFK